METTTKPIRELTLVAWAKSQLEERLEDRAIPADLERIHILTTLVAVAGDKKAAAKRLGIGLRITAMCRMKKCESTNAGGFSLTKFRKSW